MKETGMGRTRLGRFAAVTVPATAVTLGLGFAMVQGMVSAQLSATDPFKVKAANATADGLELSLRGATVAASQDDGTNSTDKKSALVTLKNGKITDLKLCADQPLPGPLGTLGLTLSATGEVPLGATTDLSADAVNAANAVLPATDIGIAQSQLEHQSTVAGGRAGGFGLNTAGAAGSVKLDGLDADAYSLSLSGLTVSNLSIAPQLGSAMAGC
jgi:hypothetical protein